MHPLKTKVSIYLLGYLSVMSTNVFASQPFLPPFVRKLAITVIDPESELGEVSNIAGFCSLVQGPRGRLFATFTSDSEGLGILVCDAKTLKPEEVFWIRNLVKDVKYVQWAGLLRLDEEGVAALCFEKTGDKGAAVSRGYLVQYSVHKKQWVGRAIEFPEIPACVVYLPKKKYLAALTKPSNWFLTYDLQTNKVRCHRKLFDFVPHEYPYGTCLLADVDGGIYGSYKGRLFRYDMDSDFFEYLGMLPCEYGHLSEVSLSAIAKGPGRIIVGGTNADGYLFVLDPVTRNIRPWGKPTDGAEIRKVVYDARSGFWGITVSPDQICRLFHFQPEKGLLEDMGIPGGILTENKRTWKWYAFQIADILRLNDGRIVLAESARQAKLLVFNPQ